ncbi:SEC-C metal-binding domain-containing protein [Tsuneonella mangrovi]|uniref:SEC-C metal-binding domain-containing protein n=1 Tax=Tsuneonella mangrovi TaxID=1982042 RepID=UPI00123737D6|nr:SEC-C metal-binding domain-containing protein [Tsuneonella mangrovi]
MTQIRTSDSEREALIDEGVLSALRLIGVALDERRIVRVKNQGLVVLDTEPATTQEVDPIDEQQSQRPAAGTRQRTARRKGPPRRQGATSGSRSSGAGSRLGSLVSRYERQLGDVEEAYPGSKLLPDEDGLWLFAPSLILEGLGRRAIFLIALPDDPKVEPRGWAFWEERGELRWIGPKHTNLFDGSVCAYANAKDHMWYPGDDLRALLDLYSVWAVRHLHLELLGQWAGRQYALLDQNGRPDPYYRLTQIDPKELCTCSSGRRYGQCCMPSDLRVGILAAKVYFERRHGGRGIGERKPPKGVVAFLNGEGPAPSLIECHEPLRALRAKARARRRRTWG